MTENGTLPREKINAQPTKAFFVEMLVRDIPLEQAVLDLVDNCVDGAKRLTKEGQNSLYEGCSVQITIDRSYFRITDNCGGFDIETARNYAFRFGRPIDATPTAHSIGQFGVGMKRALFKFGHHFNVKSATPDEVWAIDVDVENWQKEDDWSFPWAEFDDSTGVSKEQPGTDIKVTKLRPEVASKFATSNFVNAIMTLIKSKHRQFIADGLRISVNGQNIDATNLYLLVSDGLQPGSDTFTFEEGGASVEVRIIVGVGPSSPRDAGWYVICNGRVILEADRRPATGWGVLEEEENKIVLPSFHNQFARFRGIVSFDSNDAARIPWNTTKTDVDQDSMVWRVAFSRMKEMARPVITFLNELDRDIDDFSRDKSPLHDFVSKAVQQQPETFKEKRTFSAPERGTIVKGPKLIKIQYSKSIDDVAFLQEALGVTSAKAVGETTFDMVLKRQRD